MPRFTHRVILLLLLLPAALHAQTLIVTPSVLTFERLTDSPILPAAQTIEVTSPDGEVEFEFRGTLTTGIPNPRVYFASISQQRAKTPAKLVVSVDPAIANRLGPTSPDGVRIQLHFGVVGQPGFQPLLQAILVNHPTPPPAIATIVNAATRRPGPASPGAGITILGSNLGPVDDGSRIIPHIVGSGVFQYDNESSGTEVFLNEKAIPISYCTNGQVNAIIPYATVPAGKMAVVVKRYGQSSSSYLLDIEESTPGIFSVNQTGDGLAVGTTDDNPAGSGLWLNPGQRFRIFATGLGKLVPPPLEGMIAYRNQPPTTTALPVSLMIGGKPAQIVSVAPKLDVVTSVLAIEAIAPAGLSFGMHPLFLKAGAKENSTQHITVGMSGK